MVTNVKGCTEVGRNYEPPGRKDSRTHSSKEELRDKAVVFEKNKDDIAISGVYTRPKLSKLDYDRVERLIAETERSFQGLRELIRRLITRQGKKLEDLLSGKDVLHIDEETSLQAQEAISEDGQWGVEAVSDRLLSFAKAVSGGDKEKIAELKAAIEKGFKEAEEIFGGSLPEICYESLDKLMIKLDEWANAED